MVASLGGEPETATEERAIAARSIAVGIVSTR